MRSIFGGDIDHTSNDASAQKKHQKDDIIIWLLYDIDLIGLFLFCSLSD